MTAKKLYLWTNVIPLAVAFILTFIILSFFRFLPLKLPIFYSLPWGEEQLSNHTQFLIIPALLSLITLLNLTVSSHLHPAQLFFRKIIMIASLVSTLILTITFIKIVFIFV